MEHPNRGKRSVGIDVSTPDGQEVLYEIAKTADVFLTNYLPAARQKNKFDVEHIRAVNPNIIYARGSAYGDKGPERDIGGFDGTAFWTRSGSARPLTPAELGGAADPGHSGLRRLDRRHEHRRRHLRRPVPSRTHRRGRRDRRLAAEHRLVGGRRSVTQGMETGETMRSLMPDSRRRASTRSWATTRRRTAARSICASSARPATSATLSSISASPNSPTTRASAMCCR